MKDSNAAQDSREITTMLGKKPKGEIKFQSKHSQGPELHRCLFCSVTLADRNSSSARDSYSQKVGNSKLCIASLRCTMQDSMELC